MVSCTKLVLSIFALVLGIGSLVGIIGAFVVVIQWWTRIRYDFPYWDNETEDGYNLYVVVLCSWVFLTICFSTALVVRLFECCKLNLIANLMLTTAVWSGIAELCSLSLVFVYSTPYRCNIINETTAAGKNSTEFQEWLSKQTEGMTPKQYDEYYKNLNTIQCKNPHDLLTIYLSLFLGTIILSFIFVFISQWCTSEKHPELEQLTDDTRRTFDFE